VRNDQAIMRVDVPRVLDRLQRLHCFRSDRLSEVRGHFINLMLHSFLFHQSLALIYTHFVLVVRILPQVLRLGEVPSRSESNRRHQAMAIVY